MGESPRPILGHSWEWQQAYSTSAPEDGAQRDVVAQLALPIRASQTPEQARRVEMLEAQISLMDPRNAQRLYTRLTGQSDALGNLFHLTLHPTTIKSLLGQLDAKRHDFDRGTAPVNRGTDNRQIPHLRPGPLGPIPPEPKPPPAQKKTPPWDTTHDRPWQYPVPPPWMSDEGQQMDPGGSKSQSWIRSSLMAAAGALGTVVSVGVRAVTTAGMEEALGAAWLVFQITEAEPAALIGMAGEAAAEAILPEILGVDPIAVRNLNLIKPNFPALDLISPRWLAQVKTRGVLSTLAASALTEQLRSQYCSDLLDMITGGKKVDDAAEILLRNRGKLGRAWPRDLRATTREGVSKYIREKTVLLVPNDHVQPLRRTLGKDLYRRLKENKRWLDQLGIKNSRELSAFVNGQTDRIQSMGPSSADFRLMAETAANHLPEEVNGKFRKKFAKILDQAKKRIRK
jgi:hypothetical protein